jgi:hypothetical protein
MRPGNRLFISLNYSNVRTLSNSLRRLVRWSDGIFHGGRFVAPARVYCGEDGWPVTSLQAKAIAAGPPISDQ